MGGIMLGQEASVPLRLQACRHVYVQHRPANGLSSTWDHSDISRLGFTRLLLLSSRKQAFVDVKRAASCWFNQSRSLSTPLTFSHLIPINKYIITVEIHE